MADLITKIKKQRTDTNTDEISDYDIGVNAENVFIKESNNDNFSLKQLYNFLKNFFTKGSFIYQGKNAPTNDKVVIWNEIN